MIFILVFFFGIAQPLFPQQQESERFTKIITRLVEAMNNQDYPSIVREYDKGMSTAFPLFKTTYFFKNNYDTFGKVLKVDPPIVRAADQAICVMHSERGIQDLTIYIDDEGKIKGFLFTTHIVPEPQASSVNAADSTPATAQAATAKPVTQPHDSSTSSESSKNIAVSSPGPSVPVRQPSAPTVPDKQQTELSLPFTGTWIVTASGDQKQSTTPRTVLQQPYACEFSGVNPSGLRYRNAGRANEDYFGYGKEIVAPADGTVVEVIDGVRENSPGIKNPYTLIGNAIIIQHSSKEYSVLAFLKTGSIRVKAGDRISRGQVIAQCGNSGNAAEPALHFHLQDSPNLQTAKGLKFYFERIMVGKEGNNQFQRVHLPENGEVLSPE